MSTTGYEAALYGSRWEHVHHGYFSDPEVAQPLVKAALKAISAARPDVVADLGGGTGFILSQIAERAGAHAACFINVDDAEAQLADTPQEGLLCLPCQVQDLTRVDLMMDGEGKLMFCMRSLLHYFGKRGLRPTLRHLRKQMKPGEYFVHQTGCFQEQVGKDILNQLYLGMGTGKWYPLVGELEEALAREGWRVREVAPASSLVLKSSELEERYRVGDRAMKVLGERITGGFGEVGGVFEASPDGFTAYLHYHIFTCQAV